MAAPVSAPSNTETAPVATLRGMREDDLLAFTWIADPQISPDGRRVAFTRVTIDRDADDYATSLWLADAAGGEPRPLTRGPRDRQARWSPDGRTIAFVRSKEAKAPGQIHLLPMEGGEPTPLTTLEGGASDPAWSPEGERIAFLSPHNPALDTPGKVKPKNEPARVVTQPVFRENNVGFTDLDHRDHVWMVSRAGGEPRQLTHGKLVESAVRWSRDGRSILFLSDRRAEPWFDHEESKLYAVSPDLAAPTDGEGMRVVLDSTGPLAGYAESAAGRMAAIGFERQPQALSYVQWRLMVCEKPGPGAVLRDAAPEVDFPFGEGLVADQHPPRGGGEIPLAIAADARSATTLLARHGSAMLVDVDLASGAVRELTPPAQDLIAGTCSADGQRWALVIGTPKTPGDLWLLDRGTGALKKLWGANDAMLAEVALGEVEEFWYASFDGQRTQGWIVKPPGFDPSRKHPMVLQIHGGPHTAYGASFFHEFHMLAAAGYVVVYTNPRGSTSYGQAFANVIQYRFGVDDVKDLLGAVDEVVRRGYIDEKRIGVTGGSGGGYLTNWLVVESDRFAAAITQRCVSEWNAFWASADFSMFVPFWFRRAPFEDPKEYLDRSPVTFAERIKTPLMVIHSEEDWRTPIGQGEAIYRALKAQRKPTVMVRFPGENHELSRSGMPSRRVQNQEHIRKWFDHWLQGKPAPEYEV